LVIAVASTIVAAPGLSDAETLPTVVVKIAIAGVAAGGLIGYHLLSNTWLGRHIGAGGRPSPTAIAAMATVTFMIGPDLVAQMRRSVAGGVPPVSAFQCWLHGCERRCLE
jgi:hypothetical protein